MGEVTNISWTDMTFNPWIGCLKVSPACDGCYAEAIMDKRYGRVQWGAPGQGAGTRQRTSKGNWAKPKAWNRKAAADGSRPFVFCASLADVFDNQVPAEWRADLFSLVRETPNLVWLFLTKRPQLIVKLSEEAGGLPSNVAIGTTVEDQERADVNVPHLLYAKAKLKPAFAFLSCEPLLSAINLDTIWLRRDGQRTNNLSNSLGDYIRPLSGNFTDSPKIDWVITGGETDQGGHKARPTHPEWFRSLRDQCAVAGVPFHHKQNGEWHDASQHDPEKCVDTPLAIHENGETESRPFPAGWRIDEGNGWVGVCRIGKKRSGRLLDGIIHDARPEVAA